MPIARRATTSATPVSATSISLTLPTNIVGDVVLLTLVSGSTISGTPAGWTLVGSSLTVTGARTYVWWQPVTSAPLTGTVTVNVGTSAALRLMAASYSGADTLNTPAFVASSNGTASTTATAATQNYPGFVFWVNGRSASSTLSAETSASGTWAASEAYENAGTNSMTVTDGPITANSATTLTATSSASVTWNSVAVSLAAAAYNVPIASDAFTGTSGAAWASPWVKPTGTSGTATIASTGTSGQMVLAATHPVDGRMDLAGVTVPQVCDVYVDIQALSTGSYLTTSWGDLSGTDARSGNGFEAVLQFNGASSKLSIGQFVSGVETKPATDVTMTTASATWYTLHMQYDGTNLSANVYPQGTAEPSDWAITGVMPTPASLPTSGQISLGTFAGNSTSRTVGFDNLQVTSPAPANVTAETWTGANGSAWTSQWTNTHVSGTGSATIQSNAGQLVTGTGTYNTEREYLAAAPAQTDSDLTTTFTVGAQVESYAVFGVGANNTANANNNAYTAAGFFLLISISATASSGTLTLNKSVGSTITTVASAVAKTITAGTAYNVRVQRLGSTFRARVWTGSTEPSTWDITGTDATSLSGNPVLVWQGGAVAAARTITYDNLVFSVPSSVVAFTASPALSGTGGLSAGTPAPAIAAGSPALSGTGTTGVSTSFTGGAGDGSTPASILGIGPSAGQAHFSAQLAQSGAASIDTYDQNQIAAGLNLPPYFMAVTDGGGVDRVQFQVPMDGPDTSGASTPRAELRELDQTGANMAFDVSTGTHRLHGRSTITHLAAVKPETVIAQLHNGSADRISIRTQVISGSTKLLVRVNGSAVTPRLMDPYVLGTEFEWKIEVVNGVGYVYFNDMVNPVITTVAMTPTAGVTTWYFKAGDYAQSSTPTDGESPADNDTVLLRDFWHWHTGWPDPLVAPGQSGAYTASPALSGTGGLASVATISASTTTPLSGTGSLSSTATPKPVITAALSGNGTVTASGSPKPVQSVAFSGTGTVGAVGAPNPKPSVAFSGAGSLSPSSSSAQTGNAALTGTGGLSAGGAPAAAVTVPLSGSGSLGSTVSATIALPYTEPFTGADGAAWPAAWVTRNSNPGFADLHGNQGRMTSPADAWKATVKELSTAPLGDVDVLATVTFDASPIWAAIYIAGDGSVGPAVDGASSGSWYPTTAYTLEMGSAGDITLVENIAGDQYGRAYISQPFTVGAAYHCRLTLLGHSLTAKVWLATADESTASVLSYTIPGTPLTGATGLLLGSDADGVARTASWDDVTVSVPAAGTVALSGSGSLSSGQTPALAQNAALSGSGALSGAGAPKPVGTVSFAGTGSLAQVAAPAVPVTVALSAAGSLAGSGRANPSTSIGLSGSGTLGSSAGQISTGTADFTGSGSLSAGAVPAVAIALALSGAGSLAQAATPNPSTIVALSGSGGMTAGGSPKPAATTSLTGSGTLAGTPIITVSTLLAIGGSGSLVGAPLAGFSAVAPFSGVGTVSTSQLPNPGTTVSFAGVGGLAGLTAPKPVQQVSLSGSGSLIPAGLPHYTAYVALSGSGGLSGSGVRLLFGLASFAGEGSLAEGGVAVQRLVFKVIGVHGAQVLPAGPLGQLHGNSIGAATNHSTLSAHLSGSPITGGTP